MTYFLNPAYSHTSIFVWNNWVCVFTDYNRILEGHYDANQHQPITENYLRDKNIRYDSTNNIYYAILQKLLKYIYHEWSNDDPFFRSKIPATIQRKRQNISTTKKRKYSKHKPSLGGKHPQNDYDPWRDIYQEGLFNNDAKEKTSKSDTSYHRSPGHEKSQKNNLNGIIRHNIKTFCCFYLECI